MVRRNGTQRGVAVGNVRMLSIPSSKYQAVLGRGAGFQSRNVRQDGRVKPEQTEDV